jgi:hypothetical protein
MVHENEMGVGQGSAIETEVETTLLRVLFPHQASRACHNGLLDSDTELV